MDEVDSSSTGQTVFKEPAEAVPLNNRILELATEEDAEVERVLSALTAMVVGDDGGASILNATEAMAALDLASARASHAMWLGARPAELVVVSSESGVSLESAVHLPGMQHPLLLERHLPKLPRGGKVGEEETVRGFDEREVDGEEAEEEEEGARFQSRADAREAVVPVDFVVPPSTSLVAITGPNTGGKTASLKALGLALLMARAGLHIPSGATVNRRGALDQRVPPTSTRSPSTSTAGCQRSARTSSDCDASCEPATRRATVPAASWCSWTSPGAARTPRRARRSRRRCSEPPKRGRSSRWPRRTTRR